MRTLDKDLGIIAFGNFDQFQGETDNKSSSDWKKGFCGFLYGFALRSISPHLFPFDSLYQTPKSIQILSVVYQFLFNLAVWLVDRDPGEVSPWDWGKYCTLIYRTTRGGEKISLVD